MTPHPWRYLRAPRPIPDARPVWKCQRCDLWVEDRMDDGDLGRALRLASYEAAHDGVDSAVFLDCDLCIVRQVMGR